MTGPVRSGRTEGGSGDEWRWVALALPIAVMVVLLVAVVAVFGLGRGVRDTRAGTPPPTVDREPVAIDGPAAPVDAVVVVTANRGGLHPPPVLAGVGAGDVIDLRGTGFVGDHEGVIAQCDGVGGRQCRNVFPVRTDDNGALRAQYRLAAMPPGGAVVVEVDLDRGGALVGDRDRPVVRLAGNTVVVSGAVAGTDLTVLRCGRRDDVATDCRESRTLTVSSDGTARGAVDETRRGERLVLVDAAGIVVTEPLEVDAPVEPAAVDGVDLDGRRVVAGLLVALILVGVAAHLIRGTDWRVPAEAAVPTLVESS